jgi:peroxiredoxin
LPEPPERWSTTRDVGDDAPAISAQNQDGETVSPDEIDDHREFADEEDLPFDLLADPDGDIADHFDCSAATVGEHLRKIEGRRLPKLVPDTEEPPASLEAQFEE